MRALVPGLVALASLLGCASSAAPRATGSGPVAMAAAVAEADAGANQVAGGFAVEIAVRGLSAPTSVEIDGDGALCIAETVGGVDGAPEGRVLRIARDGSTSVVADGFAGAIADLLWHDGRLFVSHRGAVSVVEGGAVSEVVRELPSLGDHGNTQLAAGPDGYLYLGQGSATDAGVVGPDNAWLERHPAVRDVPGRAITLRDQVFRDRDALGRAITTRGFHPAGAPGSTSVPGSARASGAILRFKPDGTGMEAYAWGLRHPAGLQWTPEGRLYASDAGFAGTGLRPIANAPDVVCDIRRDGWYGWPDFAGGEPVTDPRFHPPGGPRPGFLLAEHPPLIQPLLRLAPRRGVAKLAAIPVGMCPDGTLLLARAGGAAGEAGDVLVIDPRDGGSRLFLRARGDARDPSRAANPARGLERPVDVVWDAREGVIYVVDRGVAAGGGVVWRIGRLGVRGTFPPDIRLGSEPAPTAPQSAGLRGSAAGIAPLAPSQRPPDDADRLPQEPVPAHPAGAWRAE